MKVLMFKVGINGLKNKIWRVIEVTDKMTIGDLAYSILASFNSLAYHLYSITYKDRKYKSYIDDDLIFDDEIVLDASKQSCKSIIMGFDYTVNTPYYIPTIEYEVFGFTCKAIKIKKAYHLLQMILYLVRQI